MCRREILCIEPENLAFALGGVEPEEGQMAELGLQNVPPGADFAEQATAGIEVIGGRGENLPHQIEAVRALKKIPELIERIDQYYPPRGAAPPAPPLPEVAITEGRAWWTYALVALAGALVGSAVMLLAR